MRVRICNFPECKRKYRRSGLCNSHLSQRKRGKKLTPIRERREDGLKRCRQCNEVKERTDFRSNGASAVKPVCRACESENYRKTRKREG